MKKYQAIIIIYLFLLGIFTSLLYSEEIEVINSSFEVLSGDEPMGWDKVQYHKEIGTSFFVIDNDHAHSGTRSLIIRNAKDNDARLKQNIWLPANGIFQYSCWAKLKQFNSRGLGANISVFHQVQTSKDLKEPSETWEELVLYLTTGDDAVTVGVTLGLGGFGAISTGEASFDDVKIEKVSFVPEGYPVVELNPDKGTAQKALASSIFRNSVFLNLRKTQWQKPELNLIILTVIEGVVILLGVFFYFLIPYLPYRKQVKPDDEIEN